MRVDVVGPVAVHGPSGTIAGSALGGRRVRVAIVALALAEGPISAERLATMIWAGNPPPSWGAALRGVIRALRTAVAPIGIGPQQLVATVPAGYVLADGVTTDVGAAREAVAEANRLIADGRHRAAADVVAPASRLDGTALLGDEDLEWLDPHRAGVTQTRMRALAALSEALAGVGDHAAAIEHAQAAVALSPLDEPAHRGLIQALDRAGDRAGVVLAYERCRALLAEELGVDPSRETVDAYLTAMYDRAAGTHGVIPVKATTFLGRDAEAGELARAIDAPGLVCVTGRGGVGKSRLAAEASTGFAGTRYWVPLASVSDEALVASTVAIEIGAQVGTSNPTSAIQASLAPLGRVLLVLDGADTVIDAVGSLVTDVLATCPTLTILITGRRPTRVAGERVLSIGPLAQPASDDPTALAVSTIGRLLTDRVAEAGGELRIDARNAPFVAALCRRCAGLPLAIELVGAQLTQVSPQDLLDDLTNTIDDGPDGLRSLVWHSVALLNPGEAAVFRRLAVLEGPVGLPLIRSVVADSDVPTMQDMATMQVVPPMQVVRILRELTERNLLAVDTSRPRWRYTQDDDLHRYASEFLVMAEERTLMLTRLSDAISALIPQDARMAPAVEDVIDVLASVRSVLDAAATGLIDRDRGLQIAFGLHRFWAETDVSEGRFWLTRLLATADETPHSGYARFALGYLTYWSGDAVPALEQLDRAARMLRGVDDGYATRALIYLGGLTDDLDRGSEAVAFVRESMELSERLGQPNLHVATTVGMGSVLAERGDPAAAGFAAQAVELCRNSGSQAQLTLMLPTAATVCWQVGELTAARAYIAEALPLLAGEKRIASVVLHSAAAGVAFADGDLDAAVEFAETADRDGTALGVEREVPLARCILARALLARGEPGRAAEVTATAVAAARGISYPHPLATCLETVVIVAAQADLAAPGELALLLAYADDIRIRGDRPGAESLRAGLDAVRTSLPDALLPDGAALLSTNDAAALAMDVITRVAQSAGLGALFE